MLQILWKLYSNSLNIHLAINSLWRSWLHFDRTPPTCPAGAGDWRLAYVKKYFLRAHRCPGWVFGSKLLICVGTNGILPLLNRTAGEQLRRHLYHSSMWFYQQYIYICIYQYMIYECPWSSHHLIISLGRKVCKYRRRQGRRRLERPGGHLRPEMIPVVTFRLPPLRTLDTWQGHEEMTRKAAGSVSIMMWRSRRNPRIYDESVDFCWQGRLCRAYLGSIFCQRFPICAPKWIILQIQNHDGQLWGTGLCGPEALAGFMAVLHLKQQAPHGNLRFKVRGEHEIRVFCCPNCCSITLLANCFGGHQ